jgi:hypothetical protein
LRLVSGQASQNRLRLSTHTFRDIHQQIPLSGTTHSCTPPPASGTATPVATHFARKVNEKVQSVIKDFATITVLTGPLSGCTVFRVGLKRVMPCTDQRKIPSSALARMRRFRGNPVGWELISILLYWIDMAPLRRRKDWGEKLALQSRWMLSWEKVHGDDASQDVSNIE